MDNMTAKVSCFARAYHYRSNIVHVFADEAAEQLLGPDYEQIGHHMSQGVGFFFPDFHGSPEEGLRLVADRQLSPSVLGRSAYCEKMLANEIRLGCGQYLIFASGYDTYAVRNSEIPLSVYELDLPEMIEDKKKRIEAADLKSSAVFLPCDLSLPVWKEKLKDAGFCCAGKSFSSLLGISYYLPKDSFRELLKTLSGLMSEGSAVCFDYPSEEESRETQVSQALAQGAGEPMKARYTYPELEKILEECGLLIYEHLDHEEMTEQYFTDYNSACPEHPMKAPEGVCYVLAVRKTM